MVVDHKTPQGVLESGHSGLVINELSQRRQLHLLGVQLTHPYGSSECHPRQTSISASATNQTRGTSFYKARLTRKRRAAPCRLSKRGERDMRGAGQGREGGEDKEGGTGDKQRI